MKSAKLFSHVLICAALSSCGTGTPDEATAKKGTFDYITFRYNFVNAAEKDWVLGPGTTIRLWRTYDGLKNVVFSPPQALPKEHEPSGTYLFNTATLEGDKVPSDNTVKFPMDFIGKKNVILGVEFLRELDGALYVIGYATYVGPDDAISRARLEADNELPLSAFSGRSCGRANGDRMPTWQVTNAFKTGCP